MCERGRESETLGILKYSKLLSELWGGKLTWKESASLVIPRVESRKLKGIGCSAVSRHPSVLVQKMQISRGSDSYAEQASVCTKNSAASPLA